MTDHEQIDVLEGVLRRTATVLAAVRPEQYDRTTPCAPMTVRDLVDHVVGWVQVFAAGSAGRTHEGDPTAFHAGTDPSAEFRAAADELLEGWRAHGLDREVRSFSGGMMPGRMIFGMTVMEYLCHGWDLARATGQEPGYPEAAAELALASAIEILLPQYRGPDSFGDAVEVPADAPAIDRFVAFMGRDPGWAAPT